VWVSYDSKANVAYIRLRDRQDDVETIKITSDFVVDVDTSGVVCGLEFLNASEQLVTGDNGKLVIVNQFSGEQSEIKIAW
jgi:uncharacterized protein YuzE